MESIRKPTSLEITKYDFKVIDGEPKIVISMVKVLDENKKYIKFAKLKEVEPFLCKYPITFKNRENGI